MGLVELRGARPLILPGRREAARQRCADPPLSGDPQRAPDRTHHHRPPLPHRGGHGPAPARAEGGARADLFYRPHVPRREGAYRDARARGDQALAAGALAPGALAASPDGSLRGSARAARRPGQRRSAPRGGDAQAGGARRVRAVPGEPSPPGSPGPSGSRERSLRDRHLLHRRSAREGRAARPIGHRAPRPASETAAQISGNIEVYYRLGLAHLARGQYAEAHAAFADVEEVSPGYRDAGERAKQVESWKSDVAPSIVRSSDGGGLAKRYTLLGELGRGGMAVVFRARDEALGREVALKFLTETAIGNKVFMEFFQREARAAGSLNHPNIVTIYDVGEPRQARLRPRHGAHRRRVDRLGARARAAAAARGGAHGSSSRRGVALDYAATRRRSSTATSSPRTSCEGRAAT